MNEKLYDLEIDSPLNDERKALISRYLVENAASFPAQVTHAWEDGPPPVLRLTTPPVAWEVRFHDEKVEIFGDIPRWAAALLTAKKREQLREQIEIVLRAAGFKVSPGSV